MKISELENQQSNYETGSEKQTIVAGTEEEIFDADVRLVLSDFGIEPTISNYQRYEKIINWREYAENIRNPRRYTLCYILWGEYHRDKWKSQTDHRVYRDGEPVTTVVELQGDTKEEALAKLDTDAYEFMEWWY